MIDKLIDSVYKATGVIFYHIKCKSRLRDFVYARMIYAYHRQKQCGCISTVGREINRNHSSIIYYLKKYADDYEFNPEFRKIADLVEGELQKNITE